MHFDSKLAHNAIDVVHRKSSAMQLVTGFVLNPSWRRRRLNTSDGRCTEETIGVTIGTCALRKAFTIQRLRSHTWKDVCSLRW